MKLSSKRILIYLIGMIILAAGLTLNTKVTLGVSSILSIPYCLSQIFSFNFSNVVFVWYCILILFQILIHLHLKKERSVCLIDVLQILVSLIFTRIMNVFSLIIPTFETDLSGFFASIPFRIIMLLIAIILTGIGAALTLDMKLIPNPGDGIVAALAELLRKPVGTSKNIVDIFCVCLTAAISFLLKGKVIGVGIGTLIAMLGVGRVINFINSHFDIHY